MKKIAILLIAILSISFARAQDKPEGLFINSKAYDFKAKDQNGNEVSMKDLRKKNYVVVVFYRGNWCPYCNRYLKRLQDSLDLITAKGAQVVAITPEAQEGISKTIERTKASFPILHDEDMKIAKAYQGAYQVDDQAVQHSKMAGIDLAKTNDQKEVWLPVTAI